MECFTICFYSGNSREINRLFVCSWKKNIKFMVLSSDNRGEYVLLFALYRVPCQFFHCKSQILGSLFPGSGPIRLLLHHHRRAPRDDGGSLPDHEWIQRACLVPSFWVQHIWINHKLSGANSQWEVEKYLLLYYLTIYLFFNYYLTYLTIYYLFNYLLFILNSNLNLRRWAGRRTTAGTSSSAMTTPRYRWYR